MFNYRYDEDTDSFVRDGGRTEILIPILVIAIIALAVLVL